MLQIQIRCKKHPKYVAWKYPVSECESCLKIYDFIKEWENNKGPQRIKLERLRPNV